MSEEKRNVPFRVEGDKVIISADPIYIAPTEIRSANVGSIVFARDLTVQDIRAIVREEIVEDRERRQVDALYANPPGPVCQPMPDGTIKMTR